MKILSMFILILNIISNTAQATTWPVFTAPDKYFLINHGYIDTNNAKNNCRLGQGRLIKNATVPAQNLCKTFCPDSWKWISKSDNQCHDLTNGFTLQRYEFFHAKDNKGRVLYTVITAYYGDRNTKFVLTIPKEAWDCYETNAQEHLLTCANDV